MNMRVLDGDMQCISMAVMSGESLDWIISFIYASPNIAERDELWRYLRNMGSGMSVPWCLVEDFNEVTCQAEKRGGRPVKIQREQGLWHMVSTCELMATLDPLSPGLI